MQLARVFSYFFSGGERTNLLKIHKAGIFI